MGRAGLTDPDAIEHIPTMTLLRLIELPTGAADGSLVWPLHPGANRIGRSPECEIVVPDRLRMVSRLQAVLDRSDARVSIMCLRGTAAMWVNALPLMTDESVLLQGNDLIKLGGFVYRFEQDSTDQPMASLGLGSSSATAGQRGTDAISTGAQPFDAEVTEALALEHEPAAAVQAVSRRLSIDEWFQLGSADLTEKAAMEPAGTASSPARPLHCDETATKPDDSRPAEAHMLWLAVLQGAGVSVPPGSRPPEDFEAWMRGVGELLNVGVSGTMSLLRSRAGVKGGMGMEGTRLVQVQNNPLKFAPDDHSALEMLLGLRQAPGYLAPASALKEAAEDLLVHQLAVMAGMRAAVFELFDRFETALADRDPPHSMVSVPDLPHWMTRLPLLSDARRWRIAVERHQHMRERLDEDFETLFGEEFRRAYVDQARRRRVE